MMTLSEAKAIYKTGGAVIRFTLHTGESIELLKHAAAYQFKRPFWFCQSSGRYMPATRIPANYEVVTA